MGIEKSGKNGKCFVEALKLNSAPNVGGCSPFRASIPRAKTWGQDIKGIFSPFNLINNFLNGIVCAKNRSLNIRKEYYNS